MESMEYTCILCIRYGKLIKYIFALLEFQFDDNNAQWSNGRKKSKKKSTHKTVAERMNTKQEKIFKNWLTITTTEKISHFIQYLVFTLRECSKEKENVK